MTRIFLALILVLSLTGCASLAPVPLYSSGEPFRAAALTPSLSDPEAGYHRYAWGAFRGVEPQNEDEAKSWSNVGGLGGGILYQSYSLRDDFTGGFFWSLDTGVDVAVNQVVYSPDVAGGEPALTAAQEAKFGQNHWSEHWSAVMRGGGQAKLFLGTVALYGSVTTGLETGEYASYRKTIDGIGRIFNMTDWPLSGGAGLGLDFSVGHRGYWSLGLLTEVEFRLAHTQSLASAEIDKAVNPPDGTWSYTSSSYGTLYFNRRGLVQLYADAGPVRVAAAFLSEDSPLFAGAALVSGGSLTAIYRW